MYSFICIAVTSYREKDRAELTFFFLRTIQYITAYTPVGIFTFLKIPIIFIFSRHAEELDKFFDMQI